MQIQIQTLPGSATGLPSSVTIYEASAVTYWAGNTEPGTSVQQQSSQYLYLMSRCRHHMWPDVMQLQAQHVCGSNPQDCVDVVIIVSVTGTHPVAPCTHMHLHLCACRLGHVMGFRMRHVASQQT
jgi:hypothetical protein